MILEDKALKFIKTINRSRNDLFAGNSGGKDSAVVDLLLQRSGVKYTSYYCNTTIDPPGTISHIRHNYKHTKILQPEKSFYQLVEKKGLPTRITRYCCKELKEYGSIGRNVFEGIRAAESKNRQGRDYIQCDTRSWQKGAQHIYVIYDWKDEDVYELLDKYGVLLPSCYKYGCRSGCVGCPLVRKKGQRQKEFDLYPKYYQLIKKAITKGMAKNPQWKLTCATDGDGEKAMQWWLSGGTMDEYFNYDFKRTVSGWEKYPRIFMKN